MFLGVGDYKGMLTANGSKVYWIRVLFSCMIHIKLEYCKRLYFYSDLIFVIFAYGFI